MYIKKSLLTRNVYAFIQNDTVITYFLLLMGNDVYFKKQIGRTFAINASPISKKKKS